MEINFENKVVSTYREISHQLKRVQESAEAVVPDTNDDIGRIASVQTSVALKSKDVTARGVTVTGEASAMLLYITEKESAVSFVRVTKSFSMDYETGDLGADTIAQINLQAANAEAKVLNPRKVSVTIEIAGELSCYSPETLIVETAIPEGSARGALHAKYETAEAVIANAVCEKTFAVNEQYSFPTGKPAPSQLVFQNADFCIAETQHIGSKIIIKGSINIALCYLSADVNYPVRTEFSSPFSQIIDTGEENMDSCTAMIEMTSAYYELIDTINGEKALGAELHAVLQIVSRCKRKLSYISDVYSNMMPSRCSIQSSQTSTVSEMLRAKLSADERVSIADDCADVLSVFSSISQLTALEGKLAAAVTLDIIYRTKSGGLSSARRMISLDGDCLSAPSRLLGSRLSDVYLRPDGAFIDCHIAVEASYLSGVSMELSRVMSVALDEENAYDTTKFPTVTLVRVDNETLWELAKKYHSSIEGISALNQPAEEPEAGLLLIPKEI